MSRVVAGDAAVDEQERVCPREGLELPPELLHLATPAAADAAGALFGDGGVEAPPLPVELPHPPASAAAAREMRRGDDPPPTRRRTLRRRVSRRVKAKV